MIPRKSHSFGYNIERYPDASMRVAIIGGGVSGLATLYELLQQFKSGAFGPSLHVSVFDERGFDGRGIPYSAPHDKSPEMIKAWQSLTLNTPAKGTMPPSQDERLDFYAWLQKNKESYGQTNETDYVPRYVFGDFLEDLKNKLLEEAKATKGLSVSIETQKITGAASRPEGGLYLYSEQSGQRLPFHHTFLAIGHARALGLTYLENERGYFRTPYNFDPSKLNEPQDQTNAPLLIWGGESTIIDTIAICETMGYTGRYVIVTRAAEKLETKKPSQGYKLPVNLERFCHLRDAKPSRVEIVYGTVNASGISKAPKTGIFQVPVDLLYYGLKPDQRSRTLRAANLINAGLWENTATFTGGHFIDGDSHCPEVRRLDTGLPCSPLTNELTSMGLLKISDVDGLLRPAQPCIHIVGSPLMTGREDLPQLKRWSVFRSWQTAELAVMGITTPSTPPIGP